MRKGLLYSIVFALIAVASMILSPQPIQAEEGACPCNGGCEGLKYYNDCGNGMCSWFCRPEDPT